MKRLELSEEERRLRRNRQHLAAHEKRKNKPEYKHYRRFAALKYKFGLSEDDYNGMFEKQKGCCAICERHQMNFKRPLYVDHCHKTNQVRQLLCPTCNTFLGAVKDSPRLIKKALEYVS